MSQMGLIWAHIFLIFICFPLVFSVINGQNQPSQSYIIRVEDNMKPMAFDDVETWYHSILHSLESSATTLTNSQKEFLYVYKTVFHGFSTQLTEAGANELQKRPEILGVFPDRIHHLHITRSPEFLGLETIGSAAPTSKGIEQESDAGSNVIIGVFDTGIWPEHRSFHDDGLEPVPSRWKGECVEGEKFPKTLCNKKLIGARYFTAGYQASVSKSDTTALKSARDTLGHGTHTASTAAGRLVPNASLLGFANGSAMGVAPKARIAVYKVCWESGCFTSDILAGFDKAIEDGVDVISLSLGTNSGEPYESDPIAIGAYAAVSKGIFVSASAGNSGPRPKSVTNVAPWIITVGASSIDRRFPADLVLQDGQVFTGSSLYNGTWPENKYVPLIYAGNASLPNAISPGLYCLPNTLNQSLVRGKIVICERGGIDRVSKGIVVRKLGALGVVVANPSFAGESLASDAYLVPELLISYSNATKVLNYTGSSKNPKARLVFRGTQLGVKPAPVVTSFSSRGPNAISKYVMKPDTIAPGLDILAAWPADLSPTGLIEDKRRIEFNIISGTSMSCPHVSGLGALLKGAHPDWSPARIKSALMTTAYTRDNYGNSIASDFDYKETGTWGVGSGHVDPSKALDPGLVYDITEDDYFKFLCASNLSDATIKKITQRKRVKCAETAPEEKPWNLNYPAIAVVFNVSNSQSVKQTVEVTRTVTHVGNGTAKYAVTGSPPEGCMLEITPAELVFNGMEEKQSYVVKIYGETVGSVSALGTKDVFGKLIWTDEDKKHEVVSPIVVTWYNQTNLRSISP